MLVCPNKFFIKQFLPLAMEQFPMTVRKEGATGLLVMVMTKHEVFEVVRELIEMSATKP